MSRPFLHSTAGKCSAEPIQKNNNALAGLDLFAASLGVFRRRPEAKIAKPPMALVTPCTAPELAKPPVLFYNFEKYEEDDPITILRFTERGRNKILLYANAIKDACAMQIVVMLYPELTEDPYTLLKAAVDVTNITGREISPAFAKAHTANPRLMDNERRIYGSVSCVEKLRR
jgi:hypothetical protein